MRASSASVAAQELINVEMLGRCGGQPWGNLVPHDLILGLGDYRLLPIQEDNPRRHAHRPFCARSFGYPHM
jgi:hypothetical protein